MIKRYWFLFTIFCFCMGLTACGNPLSKLPEAAGVNIYNESEESTGNDLVDDIIGELMNEEALLGDHVVSFIVNSRDDHGESGEQSTLYIEVITESDILKYVYYYVVDCGYSNEHGWSVNEYALNGEEESTISVLAEIAEDDVKTMLESYILTTDFGHVHATFHEGEFTDITINDEEIIQGSINDSHLIQFPTGNLSVTFTWNDHSCYYTTDIDIACQFVDAWYPTDWEFSEDYTVELNDEAMEDLSDEMLLAYLMEQGSYSGRGELNLTEDMIESYTFEDYVVTTVMGRGCRKHAEITLKENEIFTLVISATYQYKYNDSDSKWSLSYVTANVNAVDQNIAGDYSGTVYNISGEPYATVYYSFLEVNDDGSLSGTVKWVPQGEDADSVRAVPFSGTYYMSNLYFYITFDEEIRTGRNSYMNYQYLYYNLETQQLEGDDYGRSYSLGKIM